MARLSNHAEKGEAISREHASEAVTNYMAGTS